MTDGRFADTSPVFTADGLYLAFLSQRRFDPVYDAQTFDLSFPFGSRPYLVPLAAGTPSPFGPMPDGRPLGAEPGEDAAAETTVTVDADGLAERVVAIPVEEARYRYLRPVKGGLVWLRAPVTGVLGEGGAGPDDDRPRPALQRFDLRKREVKELVGALDWFRVSGDGTRLVVRDQDELRVLPSARKHDDAGETVTVDVSRARFRPIRPRCGGTPTTRPGGSCAGTSGPRTCPGWTGTACSRSTGRCWTGSAARPTSPTCSGRCSASSARRTPT